MERSIAIIGGGFAGLSAGCYGRMNGYHTTILEMHDQPGGLCTSWRRDPYTFDGCLEWLIGTSVRSRMHRVWEELGALQGRRIVDHDVFVRYEGRSGKRLDVYTDADRLERHLLDLAPVDARRIKELTRAIRRLSKLELGFDGSNRREAVEAALRVAPLLPELVRFGRLSIREYARRYQDPFLREALIDVFSDLSEMPVLVLVLTLAWMHARNAGYVVGGSQQLARALEKRYLGLGGEIRYRARVAKILVEDGRAIGVRLADGTELRADEVISAADGYATIFEMLEGRYADDHIRRMYSGGLQPFPGLVRVSLGVARDLSAESQTTDFPVEKPIEIAGVRHERMAFRHFCYDPTLAPAGKSVLQVSFKTDYAHWRHLHFDHRAYEAEKKRIAQAVIDNLDRRLPGIKKQVEEIDVATPMTWERFTGNWRGSYEGWMPTPRAFGTMLIGGIPKQLPGLEHFHMIGQWTTPGGGLPTAVGDGRAMIRQLCRRDRVRFQTTTPPPSIAVPDSRAA